MIAQARTRPGKLVAGREISLTSRTAGTSARKGPGDAGNARAERARGGN
jgi:hypothetical protein